MHHGFRCALPASRASLSCCEEPFATSKDSGRGHGCRLQPPPRLRPEAVERTTQEFRAASKVKSTSKPNDCQAVRPSCRAAQVEVGSTASAQQNSCNKHSGKANGQSTFCSSFAACSQDSSEAIKPLIAVIASMITAGGFAETRFCN